MMIILTDDDDAYGGFDDHYDEVGHANHTDHDD